MYQIPKVTVTTTYLGKPLTKRYYDTHPEIHLMYPTMNEFMSRLYVPLVEKFRESNTEQVLEISENSIKINGVSQTFS